MAAIGALRGAVADPRHDAARLETRVLESRAEKRVQLETVAATTTADDLVENAFQRHVRHDAEQRVYVLESHSIHLRRLEAAQAGDIGRRAVDAEASIVAVKIHVSPE